MIDRRLVTRYVIVASKRHGIAQFRVSDLVRGKWEKFSLEMRLTLETRLGRTARPKLAA